MKKTLALILALLMVMPLASCAVKKNETATEVAETQGAVATAPQTPDNSGSTNEPQKTEEEKETNTEPLVFPNVENPLTPERIAAIPIANANMSTDELRQICIDLISLQVSFTWYTEKGIKYTVDRHGVDVTIQAGKLYGGIPYVNVASGNVYRILRFYNTETGCLDVSQLGLDKERFGTACSGSACWGWGRVVNSATLSWTGNMTPKNGFIPVGPYESVSADADRFGEDGNPDCKDIAKSNGKQKMYESYAAMHKADGLVNNGHVTMASSEPVVVKNPDGTINGDESYLLWCEQGLYTSGASHTRYQEDGTSYQIQGNVDLKRSFTSLYEDGYLPFTFAEFLGTDPVEPSHTYLASGDTALTGNLSVNAIQTSTMRSNYNISDINTVIKDADGNVVMDYYKASANHFVRSWDMKNPFPAQIIQRQFMDGGHTVEIFAQLSTGEKVLVYSGTIEN